MKDDNKAMKMLYNEIEGMKMMSHPNIVRLQEARTVTILPHHQILVQ